MLVIYLEIGSVFGEYVKNLLHFVIINKLFKLGVLENIPIIS